MKPTLRIWLLGKSSKESDCCMWDFVSFDVMGDGTVFSWDGGTLEDLIPDFIAAKTSPFSSVPWGPDAFNKETSSLCSAIRAFAEGLILLTELLCASTSFLMFLPTGFSFFKPELLLTAFFTISISAASSTLTKQPALRFSHGKYQKN